MTYNIIYICISQFLNIYSSCDSTSAKHSTDWSRSQVYVNLFRTNSANSQDEAYITYP